MRASLPVETRVKYAAAWLKSIGAHITDDMWQMAGVVVGEKVIGGRTFLRVLWDGEEEPQTCLPSCVLPIGMPEVL